LYKHLHLDFLHPIWFWLTWLGNLHPQQKPFLVCNNLESFYKYKQQLCKYLVSKILSLGTLLLPSYNGALKDHGEQHNQWNMYSKL
jgi:hypothetical protein